MTEQSHAHKTNTSLVKAAAAKLHAGIDITLRVKVSCASACDLRGKSVKIIAQDAAVLKEVELAKFDRAVNETDEFVVKAPTELGEYTWTAMFTSHQKEGDLHEESSAPFSFIVKPRATSMAVWDVPSPVVVGDVFRIKVGVNCAAACKLTDEKIEIYNHEGTRVATGSLGDVPWSNTTALWCAEVELQAPGVEGYYTWQIKFPKADLELAHEESSYTFGFSTARPPEHLVTVEVIDKDTSAPIEDAYITIHSQGGYPYRNRTDDGGVARVSVPKGEYKIYVMKDEHTEFQTTADVTGDVSINAVLLFTPDPYSG
ncbi:MAG: hypothetical protein HY650_11040 [Acidobacteria bacterium]|nr:hypothetical protein [Acidobacteriota bacterium]